MQIWSLWAACASAPGGQGDGKDPEETDSDGDELDISGDWSGSCDAVDTTDDAGRVLSFEVTLLDEDGELSGAGTLSLDGETTPSLDVVGTRAGDLVDLRIAQGTDLELILTGPVDGDEMLLDATLCEECSGAWYTVCTASR
jgi:hypothetical protein